MLCSNCHGQHFVVRKGQLVPCPECGGMGEIHCCDGLVAQPDTFTQSAERDEVCPARMREQLSRSRS